MPADGQTWQRLRRFSLSLSGARGGSPRSSTRLKDLGYEKFYWSTVTHGSTNERRNVNDAREFLGCSQELSRVVVRQGRHSSTLPAIAQAFCRPREVCALVLLLARTHGADSREPSGVARGCTTVEW